ncbi:MAG: TdeIII family type II restriction endonuclease [Brevinematia bacterium]
MALEEKLKNLIQKLIVNTIRIKLQNYNPESSSMPFHYRLIGKDKMALYSFVQSLNTTFGTSIFEPVALEIAKPRFDKVKNQFALGSEIYEGCQQVIQQIINKLSTGEESPDKIKELNLIRNARYGQLNKMKTIKVDLYFETSDKEIYLFDLKTAKPNTTEFKSFKRNLLEWAAILLSKNPEAKVNSIIAIPYNPYEPQPYERWTIIRNAR